MNLQIVMYRRWLSILFLAIVSLVTIGQARASGPAPDVGTSKYEIHFMEMMIDHQAMAVQMGTMCLEKAVHPELKTLCSNIVTTQTKEIAVMQSWLASWYGATYAPEMRQGDQQKMARMMAMSPEEFEVAFLKMMIRHHWKAVVMSTTCVDRAYHTELAGLCEDIVIGQSAEIEQMRTWLCHWYGICNYGPKGAKLEGDDET